MVTLSITLFNPLKMIVFFLGHEMGDIIWYLPISIFVSLGGKSLNPKIYKYVLIACGIFMIVFGVYLALNIVFNPPQI